eukprot:CAMPEP_0181258390 /NCGR_PEP_ID=MMETSP1096-20121128/50755_1 /TAXON_ID=156174 ORGANISM="Chrysochromulina ericina, Strain CCMP281" /NCGR_SAMPLE_ID=MMETSP1096 /ASSEMBLY_ACC=CAM_ASM_000453 /LENGTH=77 /DNA_ID=CAMNT_0023356777 /DNA_START=1648 /DNA_END=1881 /DNA_ORIENTATION=+
MAKSITSEKNKRWPWRRLAHHCQHTAQLRGVGVAVEMTEPAWVQHDPRGPRSTHVAYVAVCSMPEVEMAVSQVPHCE